LEEKGEVYSLGGGKGEKLLGVEKRRDSERIFLNKWFFSGKTYVDYVIVIFTYMSSCQKLWL
jgi:hypothetical protein